LFAADDGNYFMQEILWIRQAHTVRGTGGHDAGGGAAVLPESSGNYLSWRDRLGLLSGEGATSSNFRCLIEI
jgi:hypothetical protein